MKSFTFERVDSPAAATMAFTRTPGARFIAGGTNLLDLMKLEIETPGHLIDVSRLGLDKIEPTSDGGVELTMTIAGTVELLSWLLGFGPQVEVMEPPSLREELAREARRMLEIYDRR